MSRRLKFSLYVLFAGVCFVSGIVLTFPYETVGRRLESEVARNVPGATLVIKEFGPAFPFGLKLFDITYTAPASDGQSGASLQVEKLRITPAWFKLLTLKPGVNFSVAALGGELSGQALVTKTARQIEAKIDSRKPMQLDAGGQLEKLTGLQLQGILSGAMKISIDPKGVIQDGNIEANLQAARINGGKVMGFPLPNTELGAPEIDIAIEKGEAKINKLRTKGDIEASVTGTVTLRPDFATSQIRGSARIKLAEAWLARNPTLKGMLGILPSSLKKPDGMMEFPLNGPLNRSLSIPGMGMR